MMRNPPRSYTFIVRIWIEPRESAEAAEEWRGEIKHVPSGQILYFRHLDTLPATIQQFVDGQSNST